MGDVVVVEDGGAILRDGRVIGFVTVAEVPTIREALAALEEVLGNGPALSPDVAAAVNGLAEAAHAFREEDANGPSETWQMAVTGLIDAAEEVVRHIEVLEYDDGGCM